MNDKSHGGAMLKISPKNLLKQFYEQAMLFQFAAILENKVSPLDNKTTRDLKAKLRKRGEKGLRDATELMNSIDDLSNDDVVHILWHILDKMGIELSLHDNSIIHLTDREGDSPGLYDYWQAVEMGIWKQENTISDLLARDKKKYKDLIEPKLGFEEWLNIRIEGGHSSIPFI